jgi:hypothetical protein
LPPLAPRRREDTRADGVADGAADGWIVSGDDPRDDLDEGEQTLHGLSPTEIAARLVVVGAPVYRVQVPVPMIGIRLHDDRENWIIIPAEMAGTRKLSMTLAPIHGAPPGAPIPDFPIEEPRAKPAQTTEAAGDQPSPIRQRQTPIEISGGGITLTFTVIPELPAIARASMTVHIVADAVRSSPLHTLGFLRMSAANARTFLTDLRNGCSPVVATGDEEGTVEIKYEITEAGPVLLVHTPGQRHALHRWVIDRSFDLKKAANELLADLGS